MAQDERFEQLIATPCYSLRRNSGRVTPTTPRKLAANAEGVR
jgi:hypothetical protein